MLVLRTLFIFQIFLFFLYRRVYACNIILKTLLEKVLGRSKALICGRYPIRPIVSRITRAHWPSFYNVVTGKTLALPNLIALQHIPLSPAGVIAKRPAPIALPNSCAA